jgi:hypothetical protein
MSERVTGAGRRRRKSSPRLHPTPAEMQGLLAQPGTALDPKLTAAWNGRVLVVFMGAGTLYASATDLLEALRERAANDGPGRPRTG